ncbi:MAG: ribonuclease HII [Acidobacteriota bacterium]
MEPFEDELRGSGLNRIAGLDEAGRGSLFGPVVAAAVVLDPIRELHGVDDSKRLSARRRRTCFLELVEQAADWSVGIASAAEIDRLNVLQATRLAMVRAVRGLRRRPQYLLIDGRLRLEMEIPQTALVRGDARCLSIAAASIMAKVARDTLLIAYARRLPGYGLDRNKGYGTQEHRRALVRRGLTPLHRRSFRVQGDLPFLSMSHELEGSHGRATK